MAYKPLKGRISNVNVGHDHCSVCGSCLFSDVAFHKCPGVKAVDPEILKVMLLDMQPKETQRRLHRVPNGFQRDC